MSTAAKLACAGLLARGATEAHCASVFGISPRTVRRWKKLPAVQAEMQRVKANATEPDPEGVLIDSLAARTDDGVNWTARQRGALEIMALRGQKNGAPQGGHVVMNIVAYECASCGKFDLVPPPGFEEDIEDAEIEEIALDDSPLSLGAGIHIPPA